MSTRLAGQYCSIVLFISLKPTPGDIVLDISTIGGFKRNMMRSAGSVQESRERHYRKLKESCGKSDIRWRIANIVVRTAHEKQSAIFLEGWSRPPSRIFPN